MNMSAILGKISVFEAIVQGMVEHDDPLLCWGKCPKGDMHVAGRLFTDFLSPGCPNVLRCCICGDEFSVADDFELTLVRAGEGVEGVPVEYDDEIPF